jgi:hypothetical protein
MTRAITLELPDTLLQSAHAIANHSQRQVEDVLVEWLELVATEMPVALLPDEQVLALRDMQMSERQQHELSELLAQQREQVLTVDEENRLALLLHTYRRGMVRKAQAYQVAVERGLQPPLNHMNGA